MITTQRAMATGDSVLQVVRACGGLRMLFPLGALKVYDQNIAVLWTSPQVGAFIAGFLHGVNLFGIPTFWHTNSAHCHGRTSLVRGKALL